MSEEIGELVRKFKYRSLTAFYALGFVIGFLGIWLPIIIVNNSIRNFFIGLPVTLGYISLLVLIYALIREPVKQKLVTLLSPVIDEWKMQALEDTINNIESATPVPIVNIETFSHDILDQRLRSEYPSLYLSKLGMRYPDTIDTLQKLLSQQPFLGTYHQVEQQFVKNFEDEKK